METVPANDWSTYEEVVKRLREQSDMVAAIPDVKNKMTSLIMEIYADPNFVKNFAKWGVSGTAGWHTVMTRLMNENDLKELATWYETLDWDHSDIFDDHIFERIILGKQPPKTN